MLEDIVFGFTYSECPVKDWSRLLIFLAVFTKYHLGNTFFPFVQNDKNLLR